MSEIQRGSSVLADAADWTTRELRALTGVIAGGDFPVVWACSEREWEAAQEEGREPKGIPWPAEDVSIRRPRDTPTIKAIRKATSRRHRAEQVRREATADLRDQIRQAQAEGISITRIAQEAGLSRQGVYNLLAARPS